jgi:hypothetical protein
MLKKSKYIKPTALKPKTERGTYDHTFPNYTGNPFFINGKFNIL